MNLGGQRHGFSRCNGLLLLQLGKYPLFVNAAGGREDFVVVPLFGAWRRTTQSL